MQFNAYISFNGRCREAFKFYEQRLGGKIVAMMAYGETPAAEHTPADWRDKIIHAHLTVGDAALMGGDVGPDRYKKPTGFCVSIQIEDEAEAERIFQALSENGNVTMPIGPTFWAKRFGMVVDQFGVPWMVNCAQPA
jgi:PhnB protein